VGNGLEDFGEVDYIAARRNSVCEIGTDAWRHRTARGGAIGYLQNNNLFCWPGRCEKSYVPGRMFGPGVTKHLEVLRYKFTFSAEAVQAFSNVSELSGLVDVWTLLSANERYLFFALCIQ